MSFPIGSQNQSDADLIPTYTVCIVGDPRSGKSCFCNRFVYSHPDWYQEGHPSMLRESDFYGPVVNSNHWLYWGTVTRRLDDETTIRFCVIEQTEFLSDTTSLPFNPSAISTYSSSLANTSSATSVSSSVSVTSASSLHSSSRLHDYILRSTSMKLCSPGKLRYYCIDQLGHEDRYKQELFPHNGPLEVHGFLVVYDVSRRACHDVPDLQQQQLTFLVDILTLISKRKKPVVVVASKRDAVDEQCLSSVTQFLQKSPDFRKIPIVEASAHRNINVELAFLTLARLLENSSNKSRISKLRLQSYQEATREQDEHQRRLREAFVNRVSLSPASFLTDWPTFLSRYSHQGDVARFIDLWGSEVAKETFEQFTAQWKTETKRRHMARLPEALSTLLLYVGPVTSQSPKELLQRLRSHSQFDHFFISVDSLDDNSLNRHSFHGDDTRIPFSLALKEPPNNGDSPFMESIKSLLIAEAWASNMSTFEDALLQWQDSLKILAGQPFDLDQLPHVDGTSVLSHDDQIEVYQKFQECLRLYTREEFLDLLLENLPHFIQAASAYLNCLEDSFFASSFTPTRNQPPHQPRSEPNRSRPISPASEPLNVPLRSVQLPPADIRLCAVLAPPRGAKEQQLNEIKSRISSDHRYRAMDYMPSERQTCLTSHLDILLHRSESQNEAPSSPPSTIQRHYSCSFMDQQEAPMQQTFPLLQCPAYQSGRCMDLVFENLFSNVGWSVGETPNTFSSRLSSVLGQGDKCLRVAVCSICTDVVAAAAGINLFRAAGFVPEGVTSPSLLTTPSSVSRVTQNLSSSWPLASALLTPVDTLIASVNGDSLISPVLGTIQASFLSHHGASLLTLATNPRQSPGVFDGVIFLLSTDENQPFLLSCICGKACYCCKCCRGAFDCSHSTPRPRSLYSRATAIKALVEHLAPIPHLIVLAGGREGCITMGSSKTMMLTSLTESSPKTPIAESSLHFSELRSRSFSFENSDEKGNNSTLTSTKPQPPFVLDALSDFLSFCWTRKLASTDGGSGGGGGGGRRRKMSSSQRQNASPKVRGNVDGSCSTIQEECLRSAPSPARRSHRHRCCHRHHCYQHRYHHHHHIHRHHYHIHHHCQQLFHRCSPASTAVIGSGVFTTSRASSNSSTGGLNLQLPKLTLTPAEIAPAFLRRQNFVRSYSFPMLSVKQTPYHDLESSGPARQKSRSLCCRKNVNNQPFESGASKQDALSVFRSDNFANEDKSLNRLMMTRRYRHGILSTSILDPPTGDCSSLASSCSPCPGAIASYPSLLTTSALSSSILPKPSDPSSILLQFAEGTSPQPPDDVDPSTPLHVMPSFHEMSPLRRKWRPVKISTKGLAATSSTTAASHDANGVNEPRATSRLKEEETFHTAEDALQFGMVHLVPCPHLMKAVVDPEKSPMYGRGHGQLAKVHDASQKTFDLGSVSKLSHHPSPLSSNGHTHLHNQSTMGTTVTAGSGGGSVSSFLSSGFRAVTSGFVRPRERRRSVSTPCGNEAPGNANNEGGCGNTAANIPSSSTPGSARASDFAHSICALPGSGTSQLTGAGYSTDTASKASTPPYVTDEVDGLCAANANPESLLPCLQVSSLLEMMEMANISNRRTYPYTPNQEENRNNSTETVTPSVVSGCQPRHWHLPTCPHRLCIPRQNLPPPPSLVRRHANNNFSSTGPHVSIINSSTQLEDHLSFRNSYYQHHHQSESVAAQPPESRHLPVEHPRLHRQQPATIAPVSLSAFQGDRRSALDLPSYLETTSAAGVVCSTAAATADSRSTTCLLASSASQRLSPPPTPISATTSKSLFNTTTAVRKNKRTMLSLFGGRTSTSLSLNHHHHQSNQHVNSHNPANSVGTFATSSGSGGASFPSTPAHEPPPSSSIVMATTSVRVNSATPPLAANFTSFSSSNSSSGGSSSVPTATNGNG